MRVYYYNSESPNPVFNAPYVIALDPGFATAGIAVVNRRSPVSFKTIRFEDKNQSILKMPFAELISATSLQAEIQLQLVLDQFPRFDQCDLIIECPQVGGQFSLGLGLMISNLVSIAKRGTAFKSIRFVQNNIPNFLLRKKKTNGTLHKEYLLGLGYNFSNPRMNAHEVDACLQLIGTEYVMCNWASKEEIREPEYKYIRV